MTHWFVAVVLPSQVFLMLIREGVGGLKEDLRHLKLIGHFRVPKALTFKMRPSAQPFL